MSEMTVEQAAPEWDLADRMRKSLRHAGGIEIQVMADYLGVSRATVSNWVNGHNRPNKPTLRVWAMRTGVPFAWLSDGATAPGESGNLTFRRSYWLAA